MKSFRAKVIPVSYTHLESLCIHKVPQTGAAEGADGLDHLRGQLHLLVDPVSYTHLEPVRRSGLRRRGGHELQADPAALLHRGEDPYQHLSLIHIFFLEKNFWHIL